MAVKARGNDIPLTTRREHLTRFLARNEIFRQIVQVHGAVIECGVGPGTGLMAWAQFSAIYEPYNHTRRIVGFDTFEGFPSVSHQDTHAEVGDHSYDSESDIVDAVLEYDLNRPIGHVPRVHIVKGDATDTIPEYLENNPHLVVALLYLDFDLYEPTRAAIETFVPRMPKGAVLAFDELFIDIYPGETQAVLDTLGLRHLPLKRFPFASTISFAVV